MGEPAGSPDISWRKTQGARFGRRTLLREEPLPRRVRFRPQLGEKPSNAPGGNYYPKLQSSVPFTPATGPRLLAAPGPLADPVAELLRTRSSKYQGERTVSAHVTFLTEQEVALARARSFLQRTDQQFHWENANYESFDDFLDHLASRKRKTIRRERKEA